MLFIVAWTEEQNHEDYMYYIVKIATQVSVHFDEIVDEALA